MAANIAMLFGRGEHDRANALVGQGSIFMAGGFGLLIWLIGAGLQATLLPLLASDAEQLRAAEAYLTAMRYALAVLVLPLAATFAFRGLGSTTPSAKVMSLAALCNLVLAPGLVLGRGPFPALGIAGAGWGTMWANAIAGVYSLVLLRPHLRALSLRDFGSNLRSVLGIGAPTALSQSLAPLGATIVVAFAERISIQCVAAVSLLGRIENFVLMYPMAVAGSVQPLVGQLWGAKRVDAVQSILATARRIALRWSVVCGVLLVAASMFLPRAFTDDAGVRALMTTGLWFTPILYAAMSLIMTTGASLVAIGKAPRSLRVSAMFSLVLIPASIAVLSAGWDALGLYVGQALAAALAAFLYLRVGRAEKLVAGGPALLVQSPVAEPVLIREEPER